MTLSIDDLVQKFIWANDSGMKAGSLTPNTTPEERLERRMDAARAGIRAVVEALQDDIWKRIGCVETNDIINKILAPRGDEAAGGTSAHSREAGYQIRPVEPNPAAAPTVGERLLKAAHEAAAIARGEKEPAAVHTPAAAPDVCEWTVDKQYQKHWEGGCAGVWPSFNGAPTPRQAGYKFCPSCGKPIKFTEAK